MNVVSKMLISAGALIALAAPAAAQSYDAEIDCGGVFVQGDAVPYTVRFEEQAHQAHTITVVVTLMPQGAADKVLVTKTFTLGSNQDKAVSRTVNLPANAAVGDYDMLVEADDGSLAVSDTCSFNVN